ncbi:FtsK/SpoIIIE domain-containing protein [Catenuloplanes japonicus]|uniref:FtsK/SpoIIIE domain-containing protein n=1 Tax=Catenuloplanes japonicus TaxID=33876 RepID=UPI00068DB7DA|nr:FtsK/SpoIIIE domain-containing protein [Catenuloplanes japonicus]
MADDETDVSRAAALHRQAAAVLAAADAGLHALTPAPADLQAQRSLAERLSRAATVLAPGWLGANLATGQVPPDSPPGVPSFVRVGTARPLPEAGFPTVVPLAGAGHLTVDADARDPRTAALLRAVLLRLLATTAPGSLLVRTVDGANDAVFAPFSLLADAGLMPPPATDPEGLRTVLAEAEQWIRLRTGTLDRKRDQAPDSRNRAQAAQGKRDQKKDENRLFLLVVASFPAAAEPVDLLRFRDLAEHGPAAGLHLLVAGWPPPALATGIPAQPLPRSTPITLREAYAIVGDPPGASFAAQPNDVGLNSPVLLDGDPPAEMLAAVCRRLTTGLLSFERPSLRDLLPAELWTEDAADGLATVVGRDGERTVTVQLNDLAPHWLIGGRQGAGKSAFLVAALAGLTARYSPDDLALFIPHTQKHDQDQRPSRGTTSAPHLHSTEKSAAQVLRHLAGEVDRRTALAARHGTTRFSALRAALSETGGGTAGGPRGGTGGGTDGGAVSPPLPRIVCVIDEFMPMLRDDPDLLTPLTAISRGARSCGVHLVLTTRSPRAIPALHERDGLFAQWTVRIALPGGGDVLEPTNESAQSLPIGTAVVNTAGGLGGPRNATRGHERLVRFPDPGADRRTLSDLHSRLSAAPPRSRRTEEVETPPVVLLGRPVSVRKTPDSPQPPVAFPLDAAAGRHLAIIGAAPEAPDLLHAATRSISAHHAPGTARFLVCTLIPDAERHADALTTALARRHEVEHLDAAGLTKALELDDPAYLVVFGLDAGDRVTLPPDRLTRLLRTGPARGVHLLSWWRGTHRLTGDLSRAASEIAGLALLDLPDDDVETLLGSTPQHSGALFHDHRTATTTPFIPFRTESARTEPPRPDPARAEQARAEPARPDLPRAEPARLEPPRTEPSLPGPARTEQARPEPARAEAARREPEPAQAETTRTEQKRAEHILPAPRTARPAEARET